MTKTTNHKAFSLIEISVVIVVIGILIAGISSGIELYDDYKLKVAQNLTKNSRVARIKDLELWFETTSENSLATGTTSFTEKPNPTDQDRIGRWNDINPNIIATAKNNATQAASDNQPKYIRNGTNGLPALKFDGSNDRLFYNGNFLIGSDYTIFVVEARESSKGDNYFLIGTSGDPYSDLTLGYKEDAIIRHDHFYANINKSISTYSSVINRIHSFTFGTAFGKFMYQNGGGLVSNGGASNKNPLVSYPNSAIGGGFSYYQGLISEIIFYTRALSDKERQEVETYLSKKWGIKLG
jgi:prepilin-type N-terminal cleavage/methylation domain-containing protein